MSKTPRDLYIPAESWQVIINTVAPKPKSIDPAFARAMEQFKRYSMTIQGEIGDAIRQCQDHLDRFLNTAHETISVESGTNSSRLGRAKDFLYGTDNLTFQVFNYKSVDTVSIREDRFCTLMGGYDLFSDTMHFMEKKVEEGNLGVLKNSFLFIHKPLVQAAEAYDNALKKTYLRRTTQVGIPADPNFVFITGTEDAEGIASGSISRVLKPGYAYEDREIQEGVVVVAK